MAKKKPTPLDSALQRATNGRTLNIMDIPAVYRLAEKHVIEGDDVTTAARKAVDKFALQEHD